jgi:hypothetical protein
MKINYKLISFLAPAVLCLIMMQSCEDKSGSNIKVPPIDTVGVSTSGTMKYEGEIISVPSPVQVATLIQKNNIPFKQELVNSLQNKERYLNETKKALNLGVYGADLAYIANYNLGQINNDYFDALASISTDLSILENIDKKLVNKLNSNLNNRDSILSLNAEFFRFADKYLKSNQSPHLSSYVLIGGWVESLHLTADAASMNDDLRIRIGEQKYSAKSIMHLISKLEDPAFAPVKGELAKLCEMLDKLESTYTYRQPINDQREKITYLRSQSSVKLEEAEMNEIINQIKVVRNIITE